MHRPGDKPDESVTSGGRLIGPVRGRGAGRNPGSRFDDIRLTVLGEARDDELAEHPDGRQTPTTVLNDDARTVLNRVDSPDIHMQWTLNPYRGCEHGCIYCYARPGHEYFGLSSGIDFETRIFAKRTAPALLRAALARRSWAGEPIVCSGVTDPYQPIERDLRITRGCLEVLAECRQPVAFITKNRLILRDLDLLSALHEHNAAQVAVSITTLDNTLAAKLEPRASGPAARLETIRRLTDAGIPVKVMAAPIIPGLTDRELPRILESAAEAGATTAGYVLLRLPHQVKALFLDWLQRHHPDRARHVESLIRQTRGGALYDATFHTRKRGEGPIADQIHQTFRLFARRHDLDKPGPGLNTRAFRPPTKDVKGQMGLFG